MTAFEDIEVSVVLPTYNEKENIGDLIMEISCYLSKDFPGRYEIIVVDDDSPDFTCEAVQVRYADAAFVRVIRRKDDKGLASAVRRGIREARGDIIAWLDCDFSMQPHKLAQLVSKVKDGYDIVVGSRFVRGGRDVRALSDSLLAAVLSRALNYFASFMLGWTFKDYTSGFAAARRRVFENIQIHGDYGDYFIEFIHTCRRLGYRVIEIPYFCLPRREGRSKTYFNLITYLKKGWPYVALIFRLKFRGKK